jgi:CRP/FNR family transcriptional regulator, anaerobic regulatory protein
MENAIRGYFPDIYEQDLIEAIEQCGRYMKVPSGESLIDIGSYIKFMPLVLEGNIKVMREDDNGDEIFLYYLRPGQACVMTLNCCMANKPSEVSAIAVTDTSLIAVPVEVMDEWLRKYRSWQNFVLNSYSNRFNELLVTIDSIAFLQLDERLLKYLEEKSSVSGTRELNTTHQDIAYDLNSSREVISRLLKQLEKRGMIELGRNKVKLL